MLPSLNRFRSFIGNLRSFCRKLGTGLYHHDSADGPVDSALRTGPSSSRSRHESENQTGLSGSSTTRNQLAHIGLRVSTFVPGIRTNFAGARRSSFWLQYLHWRYGKDNIYRLAGWERVYAIYDHISVGRLKKVLTSKDNNSQSVGVMFQATPLIAGLEQGLLC